MAAKDSDVSAGLRASERDTGGDEGAIHGAGQSQVARSKTAESYVGPPPRLPKGQYSNADIEDAVQPVGEFARIPMGIRLDSSGVVSGTAQAGTGMYTFTPAPVGDPNSREKGSGARYNTGKSPLETVPIHLLDGTARVFHKATTRPVNPYPMWNWADGMAWSVPYACMMRHLAAWYRGENNDPDSGESHLAHVICNALMLTHYLDTYKEGDDRPDAFKV